MARAGIHAIALIGVCAIACGDGAVTTPDAGDGDGSAGAIDASANVSALEVSWTLDPAIGADPTGSLDLVVTDASFTLGDVRVVGDAAVLTRSSFDLDFGGERDPRLRFAPAAPGLYSNMLGRVSQYDVRGTIDVGGETQQFRIHDEPSQALTFAVALQDVEVVPGQTEHVSLEIAIDHVIEEIDWSSVEPDGGVLEVDHDSNMIGDVREELAEAFQVVPR